jgi:hypothetical protein
MPPNEAFAFRFDNRAGGSMGVLGGNGQSAASTYRGTPYGAIEGHNLMRARLHSLTPFSFAVVPIRHAQLIPFDLCIS